MSVLVANYLIKDLELEFDEGYVNICISILNVCIYMYVIICNICISMRDM